ncbi:MAG: ammonia-forming cytochrome c nitrite reductase [Campylobacteraceae bacterium]|jgi:nitrite reductase (cytochrome c-552)|nr:ammonia-forming cytochrome c nitrite reductase [Campylobacteraceae bacterium]
MKKYILLLGCAITAIIVLGFLANDINAKENERKELMKREIEIVNPIFSSEWQRYYPREYDSWKKTKDNKRLEDMVKKWPQLAIVWAGYPFSKDYNAPRGHYYAVQDNVNTLRVAAPGVPNSSAQSPLPTACWTCKSPDVVRLMETNGDLEYYTGKWDKWGNEIVNTIGCYDCHKADTAELKVGRKYLNGGLEAAGLETFEHSSHQIKRDLVCAQCHSEYYFRSTNYEDSAKVQKTAMVVTLPWKEGLTADDMMKYYDNGSNFPDGEPFKDFVNTISKTPIVKAQHPDYELHTTGIHGKKGVSCADCHMPYTQEGAVKFSDHQIQNPLRTMDRSCMTCHRESETKLKAIVKEKYDRKEELFALTVDNLAKAHLEAGKAWDSGASEIDMQKPLNLIRQGQWRWDYAVASHGGFFHAPDETLYTLAKANDYAQQARVALVSVLAKNGVSNYIAPDFSTKENAQKLAGLDMSKLIAEKLEFKKRLEKEWIKQAKDNGILDENLRDYNDDVSSYFGNPK